MATMRAGLTKKLKPEQVRLYKASWEDKCANDIEALSRRRFTFYSCIYKNPPRLLEAYYALPETLRKQAVERLRENLLREQGLKESDTLWGMNAVPSVGGTTLACLKSVFAGESRPNFLGQFTPHPLDPNYSTDHSTWEAMQAYHLYDLWCQTVGQVLAMARGTTPIEDFLSFEDEEEVDPAVGSLVSFRLSVRGKNIHVPRDYEAHPVGTLQARIKSGTQKGRVRMQVRTMYLFSDTAAINLENGRVSGLGVLNGATTSEDGELELTIVPLLIGAGGWNLYPEKYPKSYRS